MLIFVIFLFQSDANVGNELDITIEKNCLDPQKSVTLDGVIWQETSDGQLVFLHIC